MAYCLFIDTKLVNGAVTIEAITPATGAIFNCACADSAQLDEVVAPGWAFSGWSAMTYSARPQHLHNLACGSTDTGGRAKASALAKIINIAAS